MSDPIPQTPVVLQIPVGASLRGSLELWIVRSLSDRFDSDLVMRMVIRPFVGGATRTVTVDRAVQTAVPAVSANGGVADILALLEGSTAIGYPFVAGAGYAAAMGAIREGATAIVVPAIGGYGIQVEAGRGTGGVPLLPVVSGYEPSIATVRDGATAFDGAFIGGLTVSPLVSRLVETVSPGVSVGGATASAIALRLTDAAYPNVFVGGATTSIVLPGGVIVLAGDVSLMPVMEGHQRLTTVLRDSAIAPSISSVDGYIALVEAARQAGIVSVTPIAGGSFVQAERSDLSAAAPVTPAIGGSRSLTQAGRQGDGVFATPFVDGATPVIVESGDVVFGGAVFATPFVDGSTRLVEATVQGNGSSITPFVDGSTTLASTSGVSGVVTATPAIGGATSSSIASRSTGDDFAVPVVTGGTRNADVSRSAGGVFIRPPSAGYTAGTADYTAYIASTLPNVPSARRQAVSDAVSFATGDTNATTFIDLLATSTWFRAQDLVYTDWSPGTTQATNGQTVGRWNCWIGTNYAIQPYNNQFRPILNTSNIELIFDGSDDLMFTNVRVGQSTANPTNTNFYVIRPISRRTDEYNIMFRTAFGATALRSGYDSNENWGEWRDFGLIPSGSTLANGTRYLLASRYNSNATVDLWTGSGNAVNVSRGTPWSSQDTSAIGASDYGGGTYHTNFGIRDWLVFPTTALSDANTLLVRRFLSSLNGLGLY